MTSSVPNIDFRLELTPAYQMLWSEQARAFVGALAATFGSRLDDSTQLIDLNAK